MTSAKKKDNLEERNSGLIVKKLSLKNDLFIKTEKEMDKKIIKQENKTNLKEMFKNIDNNNLHGEIETESPEGKETW